MAERIFIVGHGAVTCLGGDMDTTWQRLIAGHSGLRRHSELSSDSYLSDIAGLVEDDGRDSGAEDRALSRLSARFLMLTMRAARSAWADSGLDRRYSELDPHQVAVVVGSAFGGMDFLEAQQVRSRKRQDLSVSPFLVPGLLINQAAGQVAQGLGLYGPSVGPANACASGGHSIILGAMFLKAGDAEIAVCGASESAFMPAIVNGFCTMKAILQPKGDDRAIDDPGQASRPFSIDRAGFLMSEGAGIVVLATDSAVRRLGLEPQAELLGYVVNTDGYHITMPSRERITHALGQVLKRTGVAPEKVDYYNAHGTSTPVNDQIETQVLKDVFGDHARRLPISSIKGALGHSLGAASAIEATACIRALRDQLIPPTINHRPDPDLDLDYVPGEARSARLSTVLSASFGFGGTNNILMFGKV